MENIINRYNAYWDVHSENSERFAHKRESQEERGSIVGKMTSELIKFQFKNDGSTLNISVP